MRQQSRRGVPVGVRALLVPALIGGVCVAQEPRELPREGEGIRVEALPPLPEEREGEAGAEAPALSVALVQGPGGGGGASAPTAPAAPAPTAPAPTGAGGASGAPAPAAGPSLSSVATPGPGVGGLSLAQSYSGVSSAFGFGAPEMLGDSFGVGMLQEFPPIPNPPPMPPEPGIPPSPQRRWRTDVATAAIVPTIRALKISENQSPIPTDRLIYSFHYYNQVNYAINQRFNAPISDINVYRNMFGFEKTFLDKRGSFGIRVPVNTVNANSSIPGVGQQSSAINQTDVFFKYAVWQNEDRTSLFSTGLAIGAPTGPGTFGGARWLADQNPTFVQPFMGLYAFRNGFFIQGFTSVDVPIDPNAPTMLYNDYAVGYLAYQSRDPGAWLRSFAPVFEVHVNTPLSHRGVDYFDPWSVPDFVNLTYGGTFMLGERARLLTGIVTPVTGPRVFDFEVQALLNIYY